MPSYLTARVEFSPDPLSDVTPTYVDVTADVIDVEWWAGTASELSDPEAGGAVIRLKNRDRRYEPELESGAFYPNMDTERRWRLFLDDGSGEVQEGLWYAADFQIDFPARTSYSEVTITLVDGHGILSLDELDRLDPPDAETYEDVVAFDEPWGYWSLGDPGSSATIAASVGPEGVARERFAVKRKKRRRRGVPGPAGAVKTRSLLTLGEPGALVGDSDTCVKMVTSGSSSGHIEIPLASTEFLGSGGDLTAEAWAKRETQFAGGCVVAGPHHSSGRPIWFLEFFSTVLRFNVYNGSADVSVEYGTGGTTDWHHCAATVQGTTCTLYLDGVAVKTGTVPAPLAPAASTVLRIGRNAADPQGFTGWLDEVAVYEHALSAERIAAHYAAGTSGFPQQTAGARVSAVATSDLWSEAKIQTGSFQVQPVMEHGQSKLEEILAAVKAEGPSSLFFFDGVGDPVYQGWEWKAGGDYHTSQATFGDIDGEIRYQDIELDFDNEVYNDITGSREGGEAINVTDQASIDKRRRRAYSATGLINASDENVRTVIGAILAGWSSPTLRPTTLTLNGANPAARAQILARDIGDMIRVRRRGEGGVPIDRLTWIIAKHKRVDRNGHLVCTWTLARGFPATPAVWRLGVTGFSEAGVSTVAG